MKKLILPVLAIAFAVTSAFTINPSQKTDADLVNGYHKLNIQGTECKAENECTTTVTSAFCRVGNAPSGARLWDMNENQECVITLYKP